MKLPYAEGALIAHYQYPVNIPVLLASGVSFVEQKCCDGTYKEPEYRTWAPRFHDAGLWRIAFAWFYAWNKPLDVARALCENAYIDGIGWPELPLELDLEDPRGMPYNYRDNAIICLEEIARLSGRPVMVYTGYSFGTSYLKNDFRFKRYPLNVANYRNYFGPLVPKPWTPANWLIWQHIGSYVPASNYGVTSKEISLSVYNGPEDQMKRDFPRGSSPGDEVNLPLIMG